MTLIELHATHFNARTGVFTSVPFAGMVAEQLRRYLHSKFPATFDSRMVQVNGKHDPTVEFPRHRHVWWPKENSEKAIVAELEEIVAIIEGTKK